MSEFYYNEYDEPTADDDDDDDYEEESAEEQERRREQEADRLYFYSGTLIKRELRHHIRRRVAGMDWSMQDTVTFKLTHDLPLHLQISLAFATFDKSYMDLGKCPPRHYIYFSWRKYLILTVNTKLMTETTPETVPVAYYPNIAPFYRFTS